MDLNSELNQLYEISNCLFKIAIGPVTCFPDVTIARQQMCINFHGWFNFLPPPQLQKNKPMKESIIQYIYFLFFSPCPAGLLCLYAIILIISDWINHWSEDDENDSVDRWVWSVHHMTSCDAQKTLGSLFERRGSGNLEKLNNFIFIVCVIAKWKPCI